MTGRHGVWASAAAVLAAGLLLLWPAALNLYPLTFGDSGVYLADGIHLHASWPRPPFYGLFILPLHMRTSAWPVVVAQALIAAGLLLLVIRSFLPGLGAWVVVPVAAVLALCTSLPWFASQIMPDLFGALMLLTLGLLVLTPQRLAWPLQLLLVVFAAGCIAMHQSYLPTALAALAALFAARLWQRDPPRPRDVLRALAVPVLAVLTATAGNAVLMGQASPSPYGKIFVMTRVIFDGPGQRALQRECPRPDWTLCIVANGLPPTVEDFLFGDDGTLNRAGGYRTVAPQAWPIVLSALRAEPGAMALNTLRNTGRQLVRFATGDWLIRPMEQVAHTWEAEFPPAEVARFDAARQQRKIELVPDWLQAMHQGVGFVALAVLLVGAATALRGREVLGGLYLAMIAGLLTNAAVTGGLSGVYDRYQSRFMWLPTFAALLMLLSWWRGLYRDRLGPG